jgi:low affinity Fe/Cu permease
MKPDTFAKFARKSALVMGSPRTFVIAVGVTLVWLISGFFVGFSDSHHLLISTIGTITTGLCVFLVQSTQNRDSRAMLLKLDEIIHAIDGARNSVIGLEEKADEVVDELQEEFKQLRDED